MNKLVLATAVASALFGASYGATGAIESQNIVGYQTKAITSGQWNFIGATFAPVSGAAMTLGDIKANDAFEFGSDTLQTLNGNGSTKAM